MKLLITGLVLGVGLMVSPIVMAEETPAQAYADSSVGMSLSTGIANVWGNNQSSASSLSGFQFNLQGIQHNVFVGTGFSVSYAPSLNVRDVVLTNTISIGVVVPAAPNATVTLKCNGGLIYVPSGRMTPAESFGGTLAMEFFVARHAYMELYVGGAAINEDGDTLGTLGGGYSLGVTF